MGGALQRIEILLIGVVFLLVGAIVAGMAILRPSAPSAYVLATPQPVVTRAVPSIPTGSAIATAASTTTRTPGATAAPATGSTAGATPVPTVTVATAPGPRPAPAWPTLPAALFVAWPYLLLAVGPVGGLLLVRRRRRRMPYTNQNVGQLLAAADPQTRAANLRVMQGLAHQGLLTPDLAAAAGIDLTPPHRRRALALPRLRLPRPTLPQPHWPVLRLPRVRLPRLALSLPRRPTLRLPAVKLPAVKLPTLRWSRPALPRRHPRPLTIECTPAGAPAATLPIVVAPPAVAPQPVRREPALPDLLAAQPVMLPEVALSAEADAESDVADRWTADDRALAVAAALADIWADAALGSPVLALDTAIAPGDGPVVVTIDQHPDEEELIVDLPELVMARQPAWRACWQQDRLTVEVVTAGAPPPSAGPPIAPILAHGRAGKTTRFYPLASWRHLGLYGSNALGALHALLGSLLYSQPPAHLALAIVDNGELMPLYRDVAHLVSLPGSAPDTVALLTQALRWGTQAAVRPLVLVVVEPDDTLLDLLDALVARLRARPTTPLHLLLVQERLRSAGHELYALLPALITSGGPGPAALLPGQGEWPRRGEARLVGRGMRAEGRAIALDESAIAAQLVHLRGKPAGLLPVLWDAIRQHRAAVPALLGLEQEAVGDEPLDVQDEAFVDDDVGDPWTEPDDTGDISSDPLTDTSAPNPSDAEPIAPDSAPTATPISPTDREPQPLAPPDGASVDAAAEALYHVPDPAPLSPAAAFLDRALAAGAAGSAPEPSPLLPICRGNLPDDVVPNNRPPAPAPIVEPDNGWPPGPAPLGHVALADLMAHIVVAPAICTGQANEIGVTKNRLAELVRGVDKAQARELAEILLVWLDQAGLLAEPTRPGRLRHPRPLVTTDLTEIAAKLNTTSCPDKATVKAMWAESNEGRN